MRFIHNVLQNSQITETPRLIFMNPLKYILFHISDSVYLKILPKHPNRLSQCLMQAAQIQFLLFRQTFKQPIKRQHCLVPHTCLVCVPREIWLCC